MDTVNMECMLWSPQYTGYSEYGVYAVDSTSLQ